MRELPGTSVSREEFLALFAEKAPFLIRDRDNAEDVLCEKQDYDFSIEIAGQRFRGHLFLAERKLSAVLRVLRGKIPELESLALPSYVFEIADRAKGLFLVTGPTGSGKSTTLAALVDKINLQRQGHIITVEDPIEYVFTSKKSLISQREVEKDTKDFSVALRSALREDPDVIMIGELRDKITVETALQAAETGHLVLGTLHTVNARQSVERILSFFDGSEKERISSVLASVLLGILSQILLEKEGEVGRVLATELMVNSAGIRQCILEHRIHQIFNEMEVGSQHGQLLLNQELARLVKEGAISAENALYYTYDRAGLTRALGGFYA